MFCSRWAAGGGELGCANELVWSVREQRTKVWVGVGQREGLKPKWGKGSEREIMEGKTKAT